MTPIPAMVRLFIAWIVGILLSGSVDPEWLAVLPVGALALCAVGHFYADAARWSRRVHSADCYGLALLLLFVTLGALKAGADRVEVQRIEASGRYVVEVTTEGEPKTRTTAYRVEERATGLRWLLYYGGTETFLPGDVVELQGRKHPLADSVAYHRYLMHQGLSGTLYARISLLHTDLAPSRLSVLRRQALTVRKWCFGRLEASTTDPRIKALAQGCLWGDKRGLDADTLDDFSHAGMSHLLAVSGLHIGVLFMLLTLLLMPLRRLGLRSVARVAALLLLWGYVALIGFPTSAVRAAVMFTLLQVSGLLRRDALGWHNLALAGWVMLVYDSQLLWSLSFQMSFAATASIMAFRPELETLKGLATGDVTMVATHGFFYTRLRQGVARLGAWAGGALLVSMAAQLFTLPLVLYYFHHLPLLGFVQALLVLPLLSVYLLSLLALLACHAFAGAGCPPVAAWLEMAGGCRIVVEALSRWMLGVASCVHDLEQAWVGPLSWFPSRLDVCGFYLVLVMGLVGWRTRQGAWVVAALAVIVGLLLRPD